MEGLCLHLAAVMLWSQARVRSEHREGKTVRWKCVNRCSNWRSCIMQGESETNASEAVRVSTVPPSILRGRSGSRRPRSQVTFADQAGGPLTVLHEYESEGQGPVQVKSSHCCILS